MSDTPDDWPFWTSKSTGEEHCDEAKALSQMLAEYGLLFVSGDAGPFFKTDGEDKVPAAIYVNCNDLWMWGCADAEPLPMDQIGTFYKAWKSVEWGTTIWSCAQRNLQPQSPIRKDMKKDGAWDDVMDGLPKNPDENRP